MTRNPICDRCGREVTETYHAQYYNALRGGTWRTNIKWAKLNIWDPEQQKGLQPSRVDLCCDCYDEFITFMEGGK